MSGIPRAAVLAAILTTAVGGSYVMRTTSQSQSQQTPAQIADRFITSVIRNDLNEMGHLLGLDDAQGTPLEQVFGDNLGTGISQYAAQEGRNPADFKWTLHERKSNTDIVLYDVDFYQPNTVAIAQKMEDLMGYAIGSDGTLVIPEPLAMPYEEAKRQALNDPTIQPIHHRVPLQLLRHANKWVVDPRGNVNNAIVRVIRYGELHTDNEPFQQRQ